MALQCFSGQVRRVIRECLRLLPHGEGDCHGGRDSIAAGAACRRSRGISQFAGAAITDRRAARLSGCRALRRLRLHGARITDAGLVHFAKFSELEDLDLSGTRITGAALEPLAGLPALEVLNLNGTPLTDSAIGVLCRLKGRRGWASRTPA